MSAALMQANALALPFADESVDLVVTSPPYWALRSYQDGGEHYDGQIGSEDHPQGFLEALWAVTAECKRVLRHSGSMFVNLGDKYAGSGGHNNSSLAPARSGEFGTRKHNQQAPRKVRASRRQAPDSYSKATIAGVRDKSLLGLPWRYAIGCTDTLDLILRAELIWSKPTAMPESVADRVHRRHEQWFHLVKEPTYYENTDEIREPHTGHVGSDQREALSSNGGTNHRSLARDESLFDLRGRRPGSVWSIAAQPLKVPDHLDIGHFAAFPAEWPRRLVLGWSPPNGVVLDPFGGTGTTAMVARALGRFGVSVDLSADYLRLAHWRVFESDGASRVRERTNREMQAPLFAAEVVA